MTGSEQFTVNQLAVLVRAWREEDDKWRSEDKEFKRDVSTRLRSLEDDRTADFAVQGDRRTSNARLLTERRWRIGIITGLAVSIVFGLINAAINLKLV